MDTYVLKVQLAASEVGMYFQMTNQLSTRSSIMKKKQKQHYKYHPGVNADTFTVHVRHIETSYHDVFEYEKQKTKNNKTNNKIMYIDY